LRLYPIYEFTETIEEFYLFLATIEKEQPINRFDAELLVSKLLGKRSSRSRIIIRNFISLNILSGQDNIRLSDETQIYFDTKSSLANLLLFLVNQIDDLFKQCVTICSIENINEKNNLEVISLLEKEGYYEEKINTAKEKIYAVRRLINCCYNDNEINQNIFLDYKEYINFIKNLQYTYLNLVNFGEVISIMEIREVMNRVNNYSNTKFNYCIEKLFKDPIYSRYISFTTVNNEFAHKGYIQINNNQYYYIKVFEKILLEDTLV
jgi:hypothetical protein